MEAEERHAPQVLRQYEGDGFIVHWEPSLCIHTGNCIRRLPGSFNPRARPWVHVADAAVDDVADAVRRCPTGALRFERTNGASDEHLPEAPTVLTVPDGPLYVIGEIEVVDEDGTVLRQATRLALCRCGASKNKPYCDNTHRAISFRG